MNPRRHRATGPSSPVYGTALAITLGYALIELAGGIWTGSLALLGDAGHMFSDAVALALAAVAARLAQRPAGQRHSYGWARVEVIGASLNSLLMLVVIVALVVEAVARLLEPRPVAALGMTVIAFVGMLVNAAAAWILSRGELTVNARAALPGVRSVHDLHVWSITPGKAALSAHLEVEDLQRWPDILSAASSLLHDRYGIEHVTLQPEIGGPSGSRRGSVIRLWRNFRPGARKFLK